MKIAIIGGICVGIIAAFSYGSWSGKDESTVPAQSLTAAAEAIVATCAQENYTPACYDKEIPKLMDGGYSMEQAFTVTQMVQERDSSYQYCHVLGHYLAAKETQKDPENWKDVIARTPLGMCSNGAIHGAFQERFRAESLPEDARGVMIAELENICEPRLDWQATGMGVATCKHALGHLTMYANDGEIEESVMMCDELLDGKNTTSDRQLCYDGAFMQIFQPLEPEDFALILGKEVETISAAEEFCSEFSGPYRASCISESWPLYRDLISKPETVLASCQQLPKNSADYNRCVSGTIYVTMAQSNLSVDWAGDFCTKVPEHVSGLCFANSATRLIETDRRNVQKSLEVCRLAETAGEGEACYDELHKYSNFLFKYSDPEYAELCNGLPEGKREQCISLAV